MLPGKLFLLEKEFTPGQTLSAEFYQNKKCISRAIAGDTERAKHARGEVMPKAKWKLFKIKEFTSNKSKLCVKHL